MANELNAPIGDNGATVLAYLYRDGQEVGTPVSMTEIGTSGVYTADMPAGLPAGSYQVVCRVAGEVRATGTLAWDGSAEIVPIRAADVWSATIEAAYSAADLQRLMAAVLLGKVRGAGTGTEVFSGLVGKDRVQSTVDESGNRTQVVVDPT